LCATIPEFMESRRIITRPHFHKETNMTTKLDWRSIIRQTLAAAALLSLFCLNTAQAQNIKRGETKFKAEDYAGALKEFEPLAKKGNARAQYYLGRMYMEGKGVERNSMDGLELLNNAAQKDDPDAQYLLGDIYLHGKGVTYDQATAHTWFKKAGENKKADKNVVADATYISGRILNSDPPGRWRSHIPRNRDRANYYFNKSAKLGKVESMIELGKIYDEQGNEQEAISWFSKADKNGGGGMEIGTFHSGSVARLSDITVLEALGRIHTRLGDHVEAIKYYARDYEENKREGGVRAIMNFYRKGTDTVQRNSQKCKEWMVKIGGRDGWRDAAWCDNPDDKD